MCFEKFTKELANTMLAATGPIHDPPTHDAIMDIIRTHFGVNEFTTAQAEAVGVSLQDLMELNDNIYIYKVRMTMGVGVWAAY